VVKVKKRFSIYHLSFAIAIAIRNFATNAAVDDK
jgi:hypothetical protein